MQYLGKIRTQEEAEAEGLRVSQETGFIVVIEKAKFKPDRSPKRWVCYRGWLDRDRPGVGVMDMKDWSPPPEKAESVKPKSSITQLNMRNKLTNPFYRQGRF